jgi:pyruvate/2-oxoglutarate dehydrogenase complex dihydrolipoamide dehydrogenase (E3) component
VYNLVVLGGGSGGLVSAAGAAGVYAKVRQYFLTLYYCTVYIHAAKFT